jgi:DNA-binding winged helix-turn-helix (wHTH) protein/predicted ATPase
MIRFDRCELDPTQGLRCGGREVRLTPKSLAVLWLLAGQAGRVVTKDELFAGAWADVVVTDSTLASCVQEIRHALGDDARRPRYIETIHRRGYRFVAPTQPKSEVPPAAVPPLSRASSLPGASPLIGRDAEVDAVLDIFETARRGRRQVCFISGEPGVGKSAVFDRCLAAMAHPGVALTWAHCAEHYSSGEPYQPLLDALMRLCRGSGGSDVVAILERFAPMWLAQLPGLLPARSMAALQQTVVGATRDRMLRELANAVEVLSAREPLVIGIEDIHWSDPSTLDWIAAVAPRPDPAKLLIIATMRPPGPAEGDRPLPELCDALRARQLAREIPLAGLEEAAAGRFVAERLPPAPGHAVELDRLGSRVRQHTGGNPLFMGTVLDQLVDRGILIRSADGWTTSADADGVDLGVPDSIRPMIERQVARLPAAERRLLETASVVGDTFPVAVVAAATSVDVDEAEATLQSSASRRFVRDAGLTETPDGEVSTELAFVHTLFRDALYQGIPRRRRVDLHRRVGEVEERAWGSRANDIAAELALHFEQGRDLSRAVHYLRQAAENARRRSAFRVARAHYERALAVLERQPDDAERAELELTLRMGTGAAIMATSGFGAPEVEAAYSRARTLSQQLADAPRRFPVLWGLWLFYWGRGAVQTASELAQELRRLAATEDEGLRLQALHASWATAFSEGRFAEVLADTTEALALYDRDRHAQMAATYGSHDVGVCALMFTARALAFQARVGEAVRAGDEAVELGRSLDHRFSTAVALVFRAALDQSCGDVSGAASHAREAGDLATDEGYGLMLAWCTTIAGWAAVQEGDHVGGLATIREGIEGTRRSGSDQFMTYLLGMRADACLAANRYAPGVEAVREALALGRRTGERFYEAELHRLGGELRAAAGEDERAAAADFHDAIDVARGQGAAMLELRAAIRLAQLSRVTDDPGPDRERLRVARMAMPAATVLPDIEEADALLGGT